MDDIAVDGGELAVTSDGQDWRVAWHPPPTPPPGTPHGASAICLAGDHIVLVSGDGRRWTLPGGRPEPNESWTETLAREVREEGCATVISRRLLGFTRGVCVRGHEQGLALVRSYWRAEVQLERWTPRHEMTHRRLIPADQALHALTIADDELPIYRRMFLEATIPSTNVPIVEPD